MSNVIRLFPIALYKTNLSLDDRQKKEVYGVETLRRPSASCFISKDTFILERKELSYLKQIIIHHIKMFWFEEMKIGDNIEPIIQNSWIVKHQKGDCADAHIHLNSFLSGVLYLRCDRDSGNLIFMNPNKQNFHSFSMAFGFDHSEYNDLNSNSWMFTPEESDLFLFSSGLSHRVSECYSDIDRYVLAFNVTFKGKLGNDIGMLEI